MCPLHFSLPNRLLGARDIFNRLTPFANQPRFIPLQGKQAGQAFQPHPHQPFNAQDFLAHQRKLPIIGFDTNIQPVNLLLQLQSALGQDFHLALKGVTPGDEFIALNGHDLRHLCFCPPRYKFRRESGRWRFLSFRDQYRHAGAHTVGFVQHHIQPGAHARIIQPDQRLAGGNHGTVPHQHITHDTTFQMLYVPAIAFHHQRAGGDHGTVNHGEGAPAENTTHPEEYSEKRKA